MRILVTGAAGFIGSHLVDRLLERSDEVIGVDNFDPYYAPADKRRNLAGACTNARFSLVEADITDSVALSAALARHEFDSVIHLAAKPGIRSSFRDPEGYARTNAGGTQVVLDLARQRGVRRIVFGSSSSVYGDTTALPFVESATPAPISPYAASKLAAEQLFRKQQAADGGSLMCLRFFSVYGPRQRPDLAIRKFCELIATGRAVTLFGDGSAERDYTWVGDVVGGILAALERGPDGFEIINLGSGRATSLVRLVELIGEVFGQVPPIDWKPAQQGDVSRTLADLAKARRLLAYEPSVSVDEGIARFVGKDPGDPCYCSSIHPY